MTLDTIIALVRGTRPFKLRMVSGRVVEIPHTDFVALTPSRTSLVLTDDRGLWEVFRLSQIESVETTGEPSDA